MNDTLLSKMAHDLGLVKFFNETQKDFSTRVIYSGLAVWMKTIPLDGYDENDITRTSVTKKYHTERSKKILDEILKFFPEIKSWFYDEESNQDINFPIHSIQQLLISNDELFVDDISDRVYPIKSFMKEVAGKINCVKGIYSNAYGRYSGISCLSQTGNRIAASRTMISTTEFLDNLIKSSSFSTDEWNIKKEYFDPSIQTTTFYKSWVDKRPMQRYYISRIETGIKQYRYFIETEKNEKISSYKLNDLIIESGNLKRILLALRFNANNPLSIRIVHYPDHFELNRYITSFPYPEEFMVRALGWPVQSISDNLKYRFIKQTFPEIKSIISNLMIDINEVEYEGSI